MYAEELLSIEESKCMQRNCILQVLHKCLLNLVKDVSAKTACCLWMSIQLSRLGTNKKANSNTWIQTNTEDTKWNCDWASLSLELRVRRQNSARRENPIEVQNQVHLQWDQKWAQHSGWLISGKHGEELTHRTQHYNECEGGCPGELYLRQKPRSHPGWRSPG